MRPEFIVLGPRKTGSSWLHACFQEHPDVSVPKRVKEIFFFDRHFDRGVDWYERYFARCDPARIVGEVSATYFSHPEAPERIAAVCPDAKLLATLRSPIDRACSAYLHLWRKGDTSAPLFEAATTFPEILADGFYAGPIKRWRKHFEPESLSTPVYEDMVADPVRAISDAFRFAGADDQFTPRALHKRVNETDAPRSRLLAKLGVGLARRLHRAGLHEVVDAAKALGAKRLAFREGQRLAVTLSEPDRKRLEEYYAEDIAETSELLGRDLGALWLKR